MKPTYEQLEERIEELERQVKQLQAVPAQHVHYRHCPTPAYAQPHCVPVHPTWTYPNIIY